MGASALSGPIGTGGREMLSKMVRWHSHHHPAQKFSVLSTLIHWVKLHLGQSQLRDQTSSPRKKNFQGERSYPQEDHRALSLRGRPRRLTRSETYKHSISRNYPTVLAELEQYNTKTIYLPQPKTCGFLRPVKDSLGLQVPEAYKSSSECRTT